MSPELQAAIDAIECDIRDSESSSEVVLNINHVEAVLVALQAAQDAQADAERLAYVYSGQRTQSDALVQLELRLFNDDVPSLDEVRTAIDAARSLPKKDNT